ncbi:receptor-like protein 6 [Cynara cardunculus var. scolymus]|uniref:receptor-like protein 6 n=1 Tax=Cynara cardunculus var. scolymus TaxID=59895 RepID=UPI000D62E20E|nr:receptor-like protein 6 [Cynara cardunculus var. scolymus]
MNWKKSIDCCMWNGVTCSQYTGDVIALDLPCAMLRGTIHPNSTLFSHPHLQSLNLAFNDLTDSQLPHKIGMLSNSLTHLNISDCGFTSQIPSEISLLPKLVSLDLSWNLDLKLEPHVFYNLLHNSTSLEELLLDEVNISSTLPTYLNISSSSMKSLHLSDTRLQGKLPDNIFNLPYLEELDLGFNINITGQLPKVYTNTNIPLKFLDLTYTNLSGQILDSIGHLKSLTYLSLSNTNLSGQIPDSIGHLKSLNTLMLYHCSLMGPLPKSQLNLRHLTTLDLSYNKLNGTLPSWLFTLPSLEAIALSNNMFKGSLPTELFNHQSLKRLSLGANQFEGMIDVLDQGSIQQTFHQLPNLTLLDLSKNKFRGVWELDTLLSRLGTLEYLYLSYSGLSVVTNNASRYVNPNFKALELASCKIKVFPESLRAMRKLQFLDLSRNEIDGHIKELGGNELVYLDLSHNIITGPFPPSIWNMDNLRYLNLSNNRFSGVIKPGDMKFSPSVIDMGNNNFNGTIPHVCGGELTGLILNRNQFEGKVPSCFSKCAYLEVLDLGNNRLTGAFPDQLGRLPTLKVGMELC